MTESSKHSRATRIVGAIFGVVGVGLWWLTVMSLLDSVSDSVRTTLGQNHSFLIIGTAAGLGFVLTLASSAMWVYDSLMKTRRR